MKAIAAIFGMFILSSCTDDTSRATLDTNGNGIIDYDRCSVVITPNAIIIKKDTIIQNSNGSHWVPVVHVIHRTALHKVSEEQMDSLMIANGFQKTK